MHLMTRFKIKIFDMRIYSKICYTENVSKWVFGTTPKLSKIQILKSFGLLSNEPSK